MVLRSLLFASLLAVSACKSPPTLDGPCDGKQLAQLLGATAAMNPEDAAVLTTVALGEACEAKLPGVIAEGIKAVGHVDPADRATLIAGILGENSGFANLACPDWEKNSSAAIALEASKRHGALYANCKYDRFDLLSAEEFDASWSATGLSLLAVPMYAWLVDHHMLPAEAKRLARAMLAVPRPAPSPAGAADAGR